MVAHKVEDRIRSLELAVIESALMLRSAFPGKSHPGQVRQLQYLVDAVDALNNAMKPDPWELLREAINPSINDLSVETHSKIEAALEWHKENP